MATIDVSKGIEYLEVAASQLHGGAHYYLASLYRSGLVNGDSGSVLPNKEKFSTHLMQAVQMESPDALFCLADLHMHGSEANIDINHKTAVALYDQARQLGHGDATLALGAIYYNGLTSIQLLPDKTMAFKLYNEAAELGNLDAWRNLAAMYFMGDGVPKCENTAREIMRVIFHK